MLNIVVLVSGGGTNLQAIMDKIADGTVTNTKIAAVISNNANAYALERAKNAGIPAECISPKQFENRQFFNEALLAGVKKYNPDLVVLAGFLVIIPPALIAEYRNRLINIHPSLIPSFCGTGYYGLKVHEAVLARGNKGTLFCTASCSSNRRRALVTALRDLPTRFAASSWVMLYWVMRVR